MAKYKKPLALAAMGKTDASAPERGIGPPSKHLNSVEREIWDELVSQAHTGTLGESDRLSVELMVRLTAEMRYNYEDMSASRLTQLSNLLGKFGLTPADRQRIVVPKQKETNPFERFK